MLYVIQAVKERKPFVDEILKQIPDAVVYYDESGNAREAFVHICKDIVKGQPAVMLQDDIILTSDFRNKVENVINRYPDMLINFFSLSKTLLKPHLKKGREFCMMQCVYFPEGFSLDIVEAYKTWDGKDKYIAAIDYLTGYAWGNNRQYMVWCPSLVQHREVKSAINPRRSSKRQSVTFVE